MKDVVLDQLPVNFESATLLRWNVEEGDSVREGQTLAKLSLEGKAYNLTAPLSGLIEDIFFDEGEEVKVGDVVATVDESDSGPNSREGEDE